eukprot:gnl/TRDRNA2_/TRDRNA2_159510_c1_seq1.p1 gnl/TRDRNA2_/TRDRNA2_159510_c1~~gnl/TRDRNA2_/TRDRNA2_159510_c1_seq1.p1  ORF type:complete len:129 (-),score=35.41 gnl/TRDRNA2_/TRDRNA2_159510_c1_seq1:89-445(-)
MAFAIPQSCANASATAAVSSEAADAANVCATETTAKDKAERQAAREARHEAIRCAVRSIRAEMRTDRAAGMAVDARLVKLLQWKAAWSENDKVADGVRRFLVEAEEWYLQNETSDGMQ